MTTTFVFLRCKEMVFGDLKKRELKRPQARILHRDSLDRVSVGLKGGLGKRELEEELDGKTVVLQLSYASGRWY
jgi:hypothetical protein